MFRDPLIQPTVCLSTIASTSSSPTNSSFSALKESLSGSMKLSAESLGAAEIGLPFAPNLGEPGHKFGADLLAEVLEFLIRKDRPDVVIAEGVQILAAQGVSAYGLHKLQALRLRQELRFM